MSTEQNPTQPDQPKRRNRGIAVAVAVGIILLAVLGFAFLNYQSAQQTAATATARVQNVVATATELALRAAATATAVGQANESLRAKFNYQRRGQDNAEMVLVPAGEFVMGNAEGGTDEQPVHRVYLDAFYIDVYEVTNRLYKQCVDAEKCKPPAIFSSFTHSSYFGDSEFDNYPVTYIGWEDAKTYCEWVGKRLPTEAEWEKAARGTDGRIYPWGNEWDGTRGNVELRTGDTELVGSYPAGASPYGALDMTGNVWEWVADWYYDHYYAESPSHNPQGPSTGQYRGLRGGGWADDYFNSRATDRYNFTYPTFRFDFYYPTFRYNFVGFRCA
jgi:eukaryotic-like serine/threonine-protein kinase